MAEEQAAKARCKVRLGRVLEQNPIACPPCCTAPHITQQGSTHHDPFKHCWHCRDAPQDSTAVPGVACGHPGLRVEDGAELGAAGSRREVEALLL